MRSIDPPDALDLLDRAVGSVCGTDVDVFDETSLTARLDRLHRAQARLAAERARLVAVLEQRRTGPIEDARQRERERQQLRRDLAGRSNRPPAAAKLDAQAGKAAAEHTTTGKAFADGRIDAEHVRLIAEALDSIIDPAERRIIERDLLEVAGRSRPSVLGRHVRDLLARRAPVSVTLREERQHRERRFSVSPLPDGGLSLSGLVYGTAAETIRTALDAFRRPDTAGELRSPAQRSADAFEQLCAAALKAGEAPARHGSRPQVIVTVTTDQLALGDAGVAHLASGEPTTLGRLRHLLDDCSWARVVLAPDSTPIEASEGVRTVPSGLWRALLARDGGCTWDGCDAPAAWCDVAHGQVPFASRGRLSPDNATLLCRRHHRRFDHGGYRIHIRGDRVSFRRIRDGVPEGPLPELAVEAWHDPAVGEPPDPVGEDPPQPHAAAPPELTVTAPTVLDVVAPPEVTVGTRPGSAVDRPLEPTVGTRPGSAVDPPFELPIETPSGHRATSVPPSRGSAARARGRSPARDVAAPRATTRGGSESTRPSRGRSSTAEVVQPCLLEGSDG